MVTLASPNMTTSWRALGCFVAVSAALAGCHKRGTHGPDAGSDAGVGGGAGDGGVPDLGAGAPGDLAPPGRADLALAPDAAADDNPDAIIGLADKCVDVDGGMSANGTAVQLWQCNRTSSQRWLLAPDGTIRALGKCLDVPQSSTTPATALQLYDCNGSVAQEWRLRGDGRIVNAGSQLCLDVRGGVSDDGTVLQLDSCSDAAGQLWRTRTRPVTSGRVAVYYQTQFDGSRYVSPLALVSNATRTSDLIVGAFHLQGDGTVHLNDDPPADPRFATMWSEVAAMQAQGVRIEAMVGGAAAGSFARLDTQFDVYYPILKGIIDSYHLDGVDLDVEEKMSIAGLERLIRRLRADYGDGFVITMAPVAAELRRTASLSGIDYEQLYRDLGGSISWFNVQFYNRYGSLATTRDYEAVVARKLVPAQKLVAGMLSNASNGGSGFVDVPTMQATLAGLLAAHPELGGADSWEYFNSQPGGTAAPWQWASTVAAAMGR
jgi:chitinase